MGDWRARLRQLVDSGDPDDEGEGIYRAEPPSGEPWPAGLPPCPALAEFYAICDGGRFPEYSISPLDELVESTESVRDWAGDLANDPPAEGRMIAFAYLDFGFHVVWDADRDLVGYFDMDGADGYVFSGDRNPDLIGLPIATFLDRLLSGPWPEGDGSDDE
jgi:hypothetical protein